MADSSASPAQTELMATWECFHPLMQNDITLSLKFKTRLPDIKNVTSPPGQNGDDIRDILAKQHLVPCQGTKQLRAVD